MKKVVIALAILVLCAAVSYSFEDLTGFFIKAEPTSLVITSSITTIDSAKCKEPELACVKAGQSITVFINTGKYGAKKYFTIHKYPSNLRKGISNWCTSAGGTWLSEKYTKAFKCKGIKSINYKTSKLWSSGRYFIRLYDYTLKDYITEPFEVI